MGNIGLHSGAGVEIIRDIFSQTPPDLAVHRGIQPENVGTIAVVSLVNATIVHCLVKATYLHASFYLWIIVERISPFRHTKVCFSLES